VRGTARAAALALAILLPASACQRLPDAVQVTPGESGLAEEVARVRANRDFRIDSVTPGRLRLIARGRRLVLEPVAGLCLQPETLELTGAGVFVAVADCAQGAVPPARLAGLITLSVAAEPMFDGPEGRDGALRRMRDFLGTVPGNGMLGRGGGEARLVATRTLRDALYVRVAEPGPPAGALFAPEFWRAFAEINGRLVLVTVSGIEGGGLDGEAMLAVLAAQLARLRTANGGTADADEARLAAAAPGVLLADGSRRIARAAQMGGEPPRKPPRTPARTGGGKAAPGSAPLPPPRRAAGA